MRTLTSAELQKVENGIIFAAAEGNMEKANALNAFLPREEHTSAMVLANLERDPEAYMKRHEARLHELLKEYEEENNVDLLAEVLADERELV